MQFPSSLAYQSVHGCVSVAGHNVPVCDQLRKFLGGPVAERFFDSTANEEMRTHLRGLTLTDMGQQALEEVLAAEEPETRDWAAGEALAEAILESQHDVVLPWNTERDKRNPFASLPGADIVGLQRVGEHHRLAFGELKCSSENISPPQVMSGRSGGMGHQIDTLASNFGTICQLLKWLLPRVKSTRHESAFDQACQRYFNSKCLDIAIFGVLVRDLPANSADLQARGRGLGKHLRNPTLCYLIAIYLPWPIPQLPAEIRAGGAA